MNSATSARFEATRVAVVACAWSVGYWLTFILVGGEGPMKDVVGIANGWWCAAVASKVVGARGLTMVALGIAYAVYGAIRASASRNYAGHDLGRNVSATVAIVAVNAIAFATPVVGGVLIERVERWVRRTTDFQRTK